ncbi:MAG TPA: YCF48-related protein [Spirochaetales bacterium]|nr:YCF48-related protein [Spirochaetales bacterium]HRY54039.1 YCF48-related protein [Spirochaetia bacterium]HRZ63419.1 YCF48-related protein [Spirochaetia bacterium]
MSIRSRAPRLGPLAGALLLGLPLCLALASCEPIAIKDFIEDSLEEFQAPKSLSWNRVIPDPDNGSYSLYCAASSDDGSTILLGNGSGGVFVSRDGGSSWLSRSLSVGDYVASVAMSADGERMIAGRRNGSVYRSTDGGGSWTALALPALPSAYWTSLASSADGMVLAAPSGSYSVLISTDGGDSWNAKIPASGDSPVYLAMSADGQILLAASSYTVYRSENGGSSWTTVRSGSSYIRALGMSRDGNSAAISADGQELYLSENGGGTWSQRTSPGTSNYVSSLSFSRYGRRILACETYVTSSNTAHVSYDGGATWSALSSLSFASGINTGAMSASGARLFVIDRASGLFIGK